MKEKLEKIKAEAIRQINESEALEKLNEVRVNFLGKKGELTAVLKGMKEVALRMLAAGKYELEEIADISGLSVEEVKQLKADRSA